MPVLIHQVFNNVFFFDHQTIASTLLNPEDSCQVEHDDGKYKLILKKSFLLRVHFNF